MPTNKTVRRNLIHSRDFFAENQRLGRAYLDCIYVVNSGVTSTVIINVYAIRAIQVKMSLNDPPIARLINSFPVLSSFC